MENYYSYCPKCNRLENWRWDNTHCPICKTLYINLPEINEENEESIKDRIRKAHELYSNR